MTQRSSMTRRQLLACALASGGMLAAAKAQAQAYPTRAVRVLVGVPPGGSTDSLTRSFAEWLRQSMGQPTVVENRTGVNSAIAADAVARSTPDGYTLLAATDAFITVPLLQRVTYDPFGGFAPIGTVAINRFVLCVHPSVPVNSVSELIAYARARPGQLNYGSSGSGGVSHIGLEKFKMLTGTDMVHIPYRGAGPALNDAIAGRFEVSLWTPLAIAAHVASGMLRPLAITGPARVSLLPNVPTFAEAGLPEFDHKSWFAVFAPAGTPGPVVERLGAEIRLMVAAPAVRETFGREGVEPFVSTPDEVTSMMRTDSAELSRVIEAAHIRMD
jgi:tripartite-type tricarboxylate transporter receptor subunit TctC